MKVAVYSIAKNEEHNVVGWSESAYEADYIGLVDTGSDDGTLDVCRDRPWIHTHEVTVSPWRFDDARNAALALLPADIDICISLDLDERLQPGWRQALEVAHNAGWTRPRYKYVWGWTPDGGEGITFGYDHIHTRHGYRWKHPVHETLSWTGEGEETSGWIDLVVHHHADPGKDRGQYLPLLAKAVKEDPSDDRNAYYFGRELLYHGLIAEAEHVLQRHLDMPTARWAPERASSMRFLAQCAVLLHPDAFGLQQQETWLLRACAEAPGYREPWLDLALLYQRTGRYESAIGAAARALDIAERQTEYLTEPQAWDGVTLEKIRSGATADLDGPAAE